MTKKVYSIHGFDCGHCAQKTEDYLNKNKKIAKATIDFAGDKLFVTYKNEPYTVDELLKIIHEIEDDPIQLSEKMEKVKTKIITPKLIYLMIRILVATVVIILASTVLEKSEYFWLNFGLYAASIIFISYDIYWKVINKIIHLQNPIDENLLITLSAVGAFILAAIEKNAHSFMEASMVVILFQIGKVIEGIASNKSKEAINNALSLRNEVANLIKGDNIEKVDPSILAVNDLILINAGEGVPTDGIVVEGEGYLDTSSLTGEFVPVHALQDKEVFSGSILKEGKLKVRVTKKYSDSTIAKLIELISYSGEHKSKADRFVTKFARYYTPAVFVVALIVGLLGGLITKDWNNYILLGLKMLVVACPCAIVISVPMAYFSAVGLASKNGIVVKGTNYLDEINRIRKIATDKTGTLTKGSFDVLEVKENGVKKEELIQYICIAESLSNHPIAKAIIKYGKCEINEALIKDYAEIHGRGISCSYKGESILVGNESLFKERNINVVTSASNGITVYAAVNNKYIGYILLGDEIKEESISFVKELKDRKVETILLSGDKEENVRTLAESLGINKYYASLSPKDKSDVFEKEKSKKYAVGYVGDGVNDAATLRSSDVGFAMGAIGSDIAVDSADVIIMNDNPYKVIESFKIARMARNVSVFNIVCALFIKFSIEIIAFVSSIMGRGEIIPMWVAVLADTGLTVLLIINSLLLLYRKVDKKSIK